MLGGGRSGDLQDVVPTDFEVGGMPGRGFPRNGKHSREIARAFHVSILEV